MNRGAENEAVGVLRLFGEDVYDVVNGAFSVLLAVAAGETAGDGARPDPENFGFNSLGGEGNFDLVEGSICTAGSMGASVYKQDFHKEHSF